MSLLVCPFPSVAVGGGMSINVIARQCYIAVAPFLSKIPCSLSCIAKSAQLGASVFCQHYDTSLALDDAVALYACAVVHIIFVCHPFEIVGSVVGLVFILVIDGFKILRIGNKSRSNKAMHHHSDLLSVFIVEIYAKIASSVHS